jgi:hypothetical protein
MPGFQGLKRKADRKGAAFKSLSTEMLISFYAGPRDDAYAVCGSTSFFYAIF